MIRIEVKTDAVNVKSGTSTRTGKPYSIREQEAWAHVLGRDGKPQPYPVSVVLPLGDDQPPYPPGQYTLDPTCLYVDRFRSLTLSKARLMPIVQPAARNAA